MLRMARSDSFERGFQIGEGFDAVDLCGLDQRCDAAPCLAALVMAREQRVFSVQSDRPDQILDLVGVDLDAAVSQEGLQSVPVTVDVGELFAEARFGRDAQALCLQPGAEGCDQRGGSCPAGRQALSGGSATNVLFDGVDFGDPAQALGGDLGTVAIEDLLALAARMRPAMRDNDRLATLAGRFGQPVVARISVELQCSVEPGQERLGVFTVAPGGVEVYHPRRVIAAPTPVIACQGLEVSGFGPPAARVQRAMPESW